MRRCTRATALGVETHSIMLRRAAWMSLALFAGCSVIDAAIASACNTQRHDQTAIFSSRNLARCCTGACQELWCGAGRAQNSQALQSQNHCRTAHLTFCTGILLCVPLVTIAKLQLHRATLASALRLRQRHLEVVIFGLSAVLHSALSPSASSIRAIGHYSQSLAVAVRATKPHCWPDRAFQSCHSSFQLRFKFVQALWSVRHYLASLLSTAHTW